MRSKLANRYDLTQLIGRGNYGKVYLGVDLRNEQKVAVKELFSIVQKNPDLWRSTLVEIEVLERLQHNNIIRLIEHFPYSGHYYIVYSLCKEGDLKKAIERDNGLSERKSLKIVLQMARALIELRKHKVIHRDIKPENIFLNNGEAVLGDFGLCEIAEESIHDAYIGSLAFQAPEIHKTRLYSPKADIYSLGICFYEMLMGTIPFTYKDVPNLQEVKLQLQNRITDRNEKNLHPLTIDLLKQMVEPDYALRIDCFELEKKAIIVLEKLGVHLNTELFKIENYELDTLDTKLGLTTQSTILPSLEDYTERKIQILGTIPSSLNLHRNRSPKYIMDAEVKRVIACRDRSYNVKRERFNTSVEQNTPRSPRFTTVSQNDQTTVNNLNKGDYITSSPMVNRFRTIRPTVANEGVISSRINSQDTLLLRNGNTNKKQATHNLSVLVEEEFLALTEELDIQSFESPIISPRYKKQECSTASTTKTRGGVDIIESAHKEKVFKPMEIRRVSQPILRDKSRTKIIQIESIKERPDDRLTAKFKELFCKRVKSPIKKPYVKSEAPNHSPNIVNNTQRNGLQPNQYSLDFGIDRITEESMILVNKIRGSDSSTQIAPDGSHEDIPRFITGDDQKLNNLSLRRDYRDGSSFFEKESSRLANNYLKTTTAIFRPPKVSYAPSNTSKIQEKFKNIFARNTTVNCVYRKTVNIKNPPEMRQSYELSLALNSKKNKKPCYRSGDEVSREGENPFSYKTYQNLSHSKGRREDVALLHRIDRYTHQNR